MQPKALWVNHQGLEAEVNGADSRWGQLKCGRLWDVLAVSFEVGAEARKLIVGLS